jgi:MFS family permease
MVKRRYMSRRALGKYLGGAAAARAGDEMSGPALLLLGFAVTGRASTGSELLASLTIAAAAGGPLFGALLDRSRRPDRLLAATLAAYAIGIIALASAVGRLPILVVVLIALTAGLFNPAVAGGWTAQLPRLVTGSELDRGSALDALTYSAASLAGPALAALLAAWFGARVAVVAAAALVALAGPAALSLSRYPPPPRTAKVPAPHRQVAAGFAAILTRRRLRRATATSVISYVGIGMFVVCCPVLGAHRLGGSDHGALLITAMAAASLTANAILARRRRRGEPDVRILISTLMLGAGLAAAAIAPGWLTLAAVAIGGAGEGPQLTALFAVRHRESPEHMRGQIYTIAASLKIAGMAAGAALAGPLASRSVTGCLLVAAGTELCAAAAYLLTSARRPEAASPGPAPGVSAGTGTTVRSENDLCLQACDACLMLRGGRPVRAVILSIGIEAVRDGRPFSCSRRPGPSRDLRENNGAHRRRRRAGPDPDRRPADRGAAPGPLLRHAAEPGPAAGPGRGGLRAGRRLPGADRPGHRRSPGRLRDRAGP